MLDKAMADDLIFKALADPHRRLLLDLLFQRNGRTLSDLQSYLPMTRFGVMKHLQILEQAELISSRKVGRERLHYLNPVPIQQVYDRWVSKYARSWTRTLTRLKSALEENEMNQQNEQVFVIYIRTTPEQLWQALTDGALTQQYYFGSRIESNWQPGASYSYQSPTGLLLDGEVLEIDPPHRLVTTFRPHFFEGSEHFPLSRVTWEIEPRGAACKLTLIHSELDLSHPAVAGFVDGWVQIISGLKTVLETGEPLPIEAPASTA